MTPSPESTTTPLLRPLWWLLSVAVISSGSEVCTLRVKSQHRLYSYINPSEVVFLKHDITHLLTVLQWVHGRFCQQDFPACSIYLHLLVECIVPKVLHVVPPLDYAIFHLSQKASECRALSNSQINRTGYVICSIDRAAAASSPHIMSLTTISPDRSSERNMGRPTMDGYWCSGKFYRL